MRYSPTTRAVSIAKKLLGCEDFSPPQDVVNYLRKNLDIYDTDSIFVMCQDLNSTVCFGHEKLILCILTDTLPARLTHKDQKSLEYDFEKWWGSDSPKTGSYMIRRFVIDWLKTRSAN